MAYSVIIARESEIEANAFSMADVKVAVGFRWKAGFHASAPFANAIIFFNDVSDEVGYGQRGRIYCRVIFQVSLSNIIRYAPGSLL